MSLSVLLFPRYMRVKRKGSRGKEKAQQKPKALKVQKNRIVRCFVTGCPN